MRLPGIAHTLQRRISRSGARRRLLARPLLRILEKAAGLHFLQPDALEKRPSVTTLRYGAPESRDMAPPIATDPGLASRLQSGTIRFEPPTVFEIRNAELAGSTPVAFDGTGAILESTPPQLTDLEWHVEKFVPLPALVRHCLGPARHPGLETVALITNAWTNNYWHWLLDVLPRLEGLEYYEYETGRRPTLILPPSLNRWQADSLELMGFGPARQCRWRGGRQCFQRLVLPAHRRQCLPDRYGHPMSAAGCRWVGERVHRHLAPMPESRTESPGKIWISRRDASCRRVVNEAEVMGALRPLGYKPVCLSALSFADQVRVFSRARSVIAPHGAGLANLIFATNTSVLELFSDQILPFNANLARLLGFRYGCLAGQARRGIMVPGDADFRIDVKQLLETLEALEGS